MRTRARSAAILLLGSVTVFALAVPASAASWRPPVYEITIKNLTDGQAMTPPVVALHSGLADVFEVGAPASVGIQQIAENGNNTPLLAALSAARGVRVVTQAGNGDLVPAGRPGAAMFPDEVTITVEGALFARHLSVATMLICTNDGFTGVDSLRLPIRVGESIAVETAGYDAGTEINTEDFADIVPPCQRLIGPSSDDAGTAMSNPALAEGAVISHHPGIAGADDLIPEVHGWTDPVAEVTVTRTR